MKYNVFIALLVAIACSGTPTLAQDATATTLGDVAAAEDAAAAPKPPQPAVKPQVMVELPVLIAPKNQNDVIRAEDLTIQEFPEKRVRNDMIKDTTQIVGLAARRQLGAGQPLRLIDLRKEQIVMRGDNVALIFHDGSLEITASAKAQESGALGESIHVINLGSNRPVEAVITGPKQVEVTQ